VQINPSVGILAAGLLQPGALLVGKLTRPDWSSAGQQAEGDAAQCGTQAECFQSFLALAKR